MISVAEALTHVLALADPTDAEEVDLRAAHTRVLAHDIVAARAQPPFAASSMDGYAVANDAPAGAVLTVIGESAAGHRFSGKVTGTDAVRIFTGAPLPDGATRVVIQEDVTRDGDRITIHAGADTQSYIRPAGQDFEIGARIKAGRRLGPADVALAASMGAARVSVARSPRVALIATGDELVAPGETPAPDQIIASNTYGIAAILEAEGAETRILPIARDTLTSLAFALDLARDADLVVTIGGASVGDHDLVARAAAEAGLDRAFYKVAMRPGKPLMAGRIEGRAMVGLPGTPVSSMVCAHVFLRPLIRAMQGLPRKPLATEFAPLAHDIGPNGPRAHYMRARVEAAGVFVAERQDSGLLSVLADADALVIRPPDDPARTAGEIVEVLRV